MESYNTMHVTIKSGFVVLLQEEQLLMLHTTVAACWAGNKKGQIHVYSSHH